MTSQRTRARTLVDKHNLSPAVEQLWQRQAHQFGRGKHVDGEMVLPDLQHGLRDPVRLSNSCGVHQYVQAGKVATKSATAPLSRISRLTGIRCACSSLSGAISRRPIT